MFEVLLVIEYRHHAEAEPPVFVKRNTRLPFVPMPGMTLRMYDETQLTAHSVTWHEASAQFVVREVNLVADPSVISCPKGWKRG